MPDPTLPAALVSADLARLRWSQAQLARAVGVDAATISRLLAGGRVAPVTIARIADALGWSDAVRREAVDLAVRAQMDVP